MKKLYFLDEDEKNRILGLHESLKPKSVINEQAATNVMTDQDLLGSTNKFRSYLQTLNDFNVLFKGLGLSPLDFAAGRRTGVKGVVDALDGWVDEKDLAYVLNVLNALKGKCYSDPAVNPPALIPAMKRFVELYKEDEGEDLSADVTSVGTKTLPTGSDKLKQQILNVITTYSAQSCATQKVDDTKVDKPKVVKKVVNAQQELATRLKQSQRDLGLPDSGALDTATLQAMITKLSPRPQVQPVTSAAPVGNTPVSNSQSQLGMTPEQIQASLQQLTQNANTPK